MIKFRAWDNENGVYLYNVQDAYDMLSGFVKYDDGENAGYDEDCFGSFLDNKRYAVEQFTGLKDVNGKDIYEGDIVSVFDEGGNYYNDVIEWFIKDEYPAFDLKYHSQFYESNALSEIMNAGIENVKVIGNVHENQELLKG